MEQVTSRLQGWDYIKSLMKPCRLCGEVPTLGTPVMSSNKWHVACMNNCCGNFNRYEHINPYMAIHKWNENEYGGIDMWESPINKIEEELQLKLEGDVLKAVQRVGIDVNREELIKALQYDREQYKKGYVDAIDEFVERVKTISRPIGCDCMNNKLLYVHTDGTWHDLISDIAKEMKGGAE